MTDCPFLNENMSDSHNIFCDSSSFISTNIVNFSHFLASLERSNQIIIFSHFLDGVSEGSCDGQRKTLGNRDNYDADNSNEGVNYVVKCVKTP